MPGAQRLLRDAGLTGRCTCIAGDFFDAVPPDGDVYVLSHVVHDWDDEHAAKILANCASAMSGGGRVLLAEAVLPDAAEPSFAK